MTIFRTISKNTKDYWLELEGHEEGAGVINSGKLEPIWNIHVVCKWDGCVDYRSYSNGYGWDHECDDDCQCCEDYIHICDMDDFIDQMKQIKMQAVGYFKGKNGEEYWR